MAVIWFTLTERDCTRCSAFLQKNNKDSSTEAIKWVALLLGAGFGLLIASSIRPLGFQSLAIMLISVAMAYLGYYYYEKKKSEFWVITRVE